MADTPTDMLTSSASYRRKPSAKQYTQWSKKTITQSTADKLNENIFVQAVKYWKVNIFHTQDRNLVFILQLSSLYFLCAEIVDATPSYEDDPSIKFQIICQKYKTNENFNK